MHESLACSLNVHISLGHGIWNKMVEAKTFESWSWNWTRKAMMKTKNNMKTLCPRQLVYSRKQFKKENALNDDHISSTQ
jgi:hypothetical protein